MGQGNAGSGGGTKGGNSGGSGGTKGGQTPNLPSTTGNPSGGGRGNAPPKPKKK